jgi:hypothetical protein
MRQQDDRFGTVSLQPWPELVSEEDIVNRNNKNCYEMLKYCYEQSPQKNHTSLAGYEVTDHFVTQDLMTEVEAKMAFEYLLDEDLITFKDFDGVIEITEKGKLRFERSLKDPDHLMDLFARSNQKTLSGTNDPSTTNDHNKPEETIDEYRTVYDLRDSQIENFVVNVFKPGDQLIRRRSEIYDLRNCKIANFVINQGEIVHQDQS